MNYVEAVLQVDLLVHGPEFDRIGVTDPARSRRLDKPEGAQQEYGLLIHLLPDHPRDFPREQWRHRMPQVLGQGHSAQRRPVMHLHPRIVHRFPKPSSEAR